MSLNPALIIDIELLKLFTQRKYYDHYNHIIDHDLFGYETKQILKAYDNYYEGTTSDIKFSEFVPFFFSKNRKLLKDDKLHFKQILEYINKYELKDENETVKLLKKDKLQKQINKIMDTDFDISKIKKLVEQYNTETNSDSKLLSYISPNIIDHADVLTKQNGLRWGLPTLNKTVGTLGKGDFGIVEAYSNVGKTAFIISQLVHFVPQLTANDSILYFNNEGLDQKILMRFYCALLNVKEDTVKKHKEKAVKAYTKKLHGNKDLFKIFSIRNLARSEIKNLVEYYKPAIIIIDTVDKILNTKELEDGRRPYDSLYAWLRDLSCEFCPIIGTTQATVKKNQEGVIFKPLSQYDMHHGPTDKPSNTEFVIGVQEVPYDKNLKQISVARTKTGHDNISFFCRFNPLNSSYVEEKK